MRNSNWAARTAVFDGVLLGAAALALRLPSFRTTNVFHPDEAMFVYNSLELLSFSRWRPEHFWADLGLLLPAFYSLLAAGLVVSGKLASVSGLWAWYKANPVFFHLAGQCLVAGIGSATVVLLYAFCRRWFNRKAAWIAGALLCVSFSHVRNSHFLTPDILAAFLILGALGMTLEAAASQRMGTAAVAGLLAGAAMAAKFSAIPVILSLPAAFVGLYGWRGWRCRALWAGMFMPLAGFFLASPYSFIFFPEFAQQFRHVTMSVIAKPGLACPSPLTAYGLDLLPAGLGWPGFAAALAGIAAGLKHWKRFLPLYLFGLAYFVMLLKQPCCFERYALPLLPLLALSAGAAVASITSRWIFRVMVLLVLLTPLAYSIRFAQLSRRPDVRQEALAWLTSHVQPGEKIFLMWGTTGRGPATAVLWNGSNPVAMDQGLIDSKTLPAVTIGPFEQYRDYRWVVDNSYYRATALHPSTAEHYPALYQAYAQFCADLDREGELVQTFSPMKPGKEWHFFAEDVYGPFGRLFERRQAGPEVKIYRLTPKPGAVPDKEVVYDVLGR